MAVYGYVFADLLTDTNITELALQEVQMQRRIVIPGTFQASYPMTNLTETERARKIIPGRTIVHVFRESDLLLSFPIWYAKPAEDEDGNLTLELSGASLESYAYRRKIRADLSYVQQDQLDIARALLTHMQSRTEGDIGLELLGGDSGVIRDRNYKTSESGSYGERLEQLANVLNGFEYIVRTRLDPVTGGRVKEWVPGYPALGNPAPNIEISQPGRVKSWSYPDDATETATSWQARGDTLQDDLSQQSEPLMSDVFEDTERLAAGWPLLDRTEDFSSVRVKATLDAHAQALRDTRSGSVRVPTVSVHFGDRFVIHPNLVGSWARFTLVNDYFPLDGDGEPTLSRSSRIVGLDYTPDSDDSDEYANVIFMEA